MAIQQIQTSSTFKPDMLGDIVEVTIYDKTDGSTSQAVGTLRAYSISQGLLVAEFDGDRDVPSIKMYTERATLSITHYEYILDLTTSEDDQ